PCPRARMPDAALTALYALSLHDALPISVYMLTAPIPATRLALEKAGLGIDDIDVTEINEAFAPVPMSWAEELGADMAKVNPNGRSEEHTSELQSREKRVCRQLLQKKHTA